MLKIILRILGLVGVWGMVAAIVIVIDPEIIRDVILPGWYLPMIVAIGAGLLYTTSLIMGLTKYSVLLSLILSIFVALLLRL